MIAKLDRSILRAVTYYVCRWVEKHNFEKHKIDFKLKWEWWHLYTHFVVAVFIPVVLYALEGKVVSAVFQLFVWTGIAWFQWDRIQTVTHMEKPYYDNIYKNRDNHSFRKWIVEFHAQDFEEGRKVRLSMDFFIIGMTLVLYITFMVLMPEPASHVIWTYILGGAISNFFKGYIYYVNDFEPPKQRQKVSDMLTELMQRVWAQETRAFAPTPA